MKKLLALCFIFSLSVPGNAQKQGAKDSIKVFYDGLFSVLKKGYLHRKQVNWPAVEAETRQNHDSADLQSLLSNRILIKSRIANLRHQVPRNISTNFKKHPSQMKLIIFFLGISTFCFSQKISFIYETKYKLNSEKPDEVNSGKMSLDLKNNTSIFRDSLERKSDSVRLNSGNGSFKMGVENQFYVKKNLAQKRIGKNNHLFGKRLSSSN